MAEQDISGTLVTLSPSADANETAIREAMSRIAQQEPECLNAVAAAVSDVLGYTRFSHRYAIAVLALEALSKCENARPAGVTE